MNDDLEPLMRRVSPRGAPPELRSRVLDAVRLELEVSPRSRWIRGPGTVVAAALLAGVVLNYWAMTETDRRFAALLGTPPKHRLAAEIAAIDPVESAQSSRDVFRNYAARLQQTIRSLTANFEETDDETPAKNPQMGRPVRGHGYRHRPDRQRVVCLE